MLKQTDQVPTIRESNPGRVATSGAPPDPNAGPTTKPPTHSPTVENRRTTDATKSRPNQKDVKLGTVADVTPKGSDQLEQAVVNYDSHG